MKISKATATNARRLFRLCMTDGRLDEDRLRLVFRRVAEEKPRDFVGILFAIKRLLHLELERRRVVVESAAELDDASRQRVADGLAATYGEGLSFEYHINPALLGGLRIRVGDDVWDGSVQGRIDRLANAF
jgi:F-type H+-transporting ATPase subunit delta